MRSFTLQATLSNVCHICFAALRSNSNDEEIADVEGHHTDSNAKVMSSQSDSSNHNNNFVHKAHAKNGMVKIAEEQLQAGSGQTLLFIEVKNPCDNSSKTIKYPHDSRPA